MCCFSRGQKIAPNDDGFIKRIAFSDRMENEIVLTIIPFINNDDTILCCVDIISLYDEMNIKVISLEQYMELTYQSYKCNKPLCISDEYFKHLSNLGCIVKTNEDIDLIYKRDGVDGLLNHFESLDHRFVEFFSDRKAINYLAYLLWINGYVLGTDDESSTWHVYHEE